MKSARLWKNLVILTILAVPLLVVGSSFSKSSAKSGVDATATKEHERATEVTTIRANRIELTDGEGKTAAVLEVSPEGRLRLGLKKVEDGIEVCSLFTVPRFDKGVQDGWSTNLACRAEQWWWWEGVRPLR